MIRDDKDVQRVRPEVAEHLVSHILRSAGVPSDQADQVARSLVLAELRGQASHGLVRLETYVKRLNAGLISKGLGPTLVSDVGALMIFDGHDGFGHVVGLHVMDACIERARATGVAAAAVRNSTHFGIAGVFALRAAAAGMIGLAASNGAARMPPVGTKTAVLGTNPLAIAIPASGSEPLLLDMATSATALGRIIVAKERGERIPEGWALTKDGAPTTDAAVALGGLILPMAGPKGFGLAIVLEVLSACLSGAAIGQRAGSMYNTWDRPEGLGHFFLAISVAATGRAEAFLNSIGELARQVHAAASVDGSAHGLLPGEIEAQRETASRRDGIEIEPTVRTSLRRLAGEAGVAWTLGE